jgi:hypothetical protein
MRKAIFLWIGIVLAVVASWLITPESIWGYLFFERIPILIGLFLVALPLIAKFGLPAVLKNLFVLRGRWQLTFVIVSAVTAGLAIILTASIILANASARFSIPKLIEIPEFWQYGLAIAISLPICITATDLSKEKLEDRERWIGLLTGGILSVLLLSAVNWARQWLDSSAFFKKLIINVIIFFGKQETGGYIDKSGELATGQLTAVAFLLVGLIVYVLVGFIFKPRSISDRSEAPALLFVMLIVTVITFLLTGATFYFDYFRVPSLLLFLIISAMSYYAFGVDHFFQLVRDKNEYLNKGSENDELRNFADVLDKRLLQDQTGEGRTLVVVCASGGGIQASGWTVQVLTGLQELLGKSFTQSIGLISSVSGGSVGTMYYLDRFNEKGYAEVEYINDQGNSETDDHCKGTFTTIFRSATKDSLDAVGWGLAYPDLWRIIGLPFLAPKNCDRGIAIEKDWQGELKTPQTKKTLATWREQILQGKIPIPVFNATLVENGWRFLITPMTFGKVDEKQYRDFNTLYGAYDIDIVTAARLSSTFPYVSPICRPMYPEDKNIKGENYHVADGGYFDNSGFVTATEWLDKLLNPKNTLNIKRVLIVQINSFPKSSTNGTVSGKDGWFMATVGPLLTLFKVRDPILATRNLMEVDLLINRWKDKGVEIDYFPIFFPQQTEFSKNGQHQPPLSWKLTDSQKEAIKIGWKILKETKVIQDIKELWHEKWNMPEDEDLV